MNTRTLYYKLRKAIEKKMKTTTSVIIYEMTSGVASKNTLTRVYNMADKEIASAQSLLKLGVINKQEYRERYILNENIKESVSLEKFRMF
jgi:hypothetical protein|nr:MAG TPA: hypothetical protein [Caudoviricetes sp.]